MFSERCLKICLISADGRTAKGELTSPATATGALAVAWILGTTCCASALDETSKQNPKAKRRTLIDKPPNKHTNESGLSGLIEATWQGRPRVGSPTDRLFLSECAKCSAPIRLARTGYAQVLAAGRTALVLYQEVLQGGGSPWSIAHVAPTLRLGRECSAENPVVEQGQPGLMPSQTSSCPTSTCQRQQYLVDAGLQLRPTYLSMSGVARFAES
jgi:hypothetical protein